MPWFIFDNYYLRGFIKLLFLVNLFWGFIFISARLMFIEMRLATSKKSPNEGKVYSIILYGLLITVAAIVYLVEDYYLDSLTIKKEPVLFKCVSV